jgi:hypothetical protein
VVELLDAVNVVELLDAVNVVELLDAYVDADAIHDADAVAVILLDIALLVDCNPNTHRFRYHRIFSRGHHTNNP